jgi:hypothetical protein
MRMFKTTTKLAAASLSLTTMLALGGCKAIQPKPQCKAWSSDYAAKYTVVSKSKEDCEPLSGEVLHVQYYRTKPDATDNRPSIAIEASSVADAIATGEEHEVEVKAEQDAKGMFPYFSLGKYTSSDPDDDDMCSAPTLNETHVTVAEVPADPMVMGSEPIPAADITYKWSKVKMLVTPASNAVYFGAELDRTEGECTITYKVTAVNPAVFCGDGKNPVLDDMGMPVLDDMGNPEFEDDPTTGKPVADKCDATIQGTGLNQDLTYKCDASEDGMSGTHLCLPVQDFPKQK